MQFNLLDITETPQDFSDKSVMIPLSGGINSAAVLCFIGEYHPDNLKPRELHLFYSHFREHSPDTFKFVKDCIRYARRRFSCIKVRITRHSVVDFFEQEKMIPHPTISPCSIKLKIKPREAYTKENAIDFEMVGFVRSEMRRYRRQKSYGSQKTLYPILRMTDVDCFSLVKRIIGWYPAIYDIRENGKQVFTHNNCLPCKNMSAKQLASVGKYFPAYAKRAIDLQRRLPVVGYWGRDDVLDVFKCDACERLG